MTNIRWRGRMPTCALAAIFTIACTGLASAHVTLDK